MEFIGVFLLGVFSSYWAVAACLILAMWAECTEHHISAATLSISAVGASYFIWGFSPLWFLAYIPVGILWSIWRWNLYTRDCLDLAKQGKLQINATWVGSNPKPDEVYSSLQHAVDLNSQVHLVVSWIFSFPISIIERSTSDVVRAVKALVKGKLAAIYNKFTKDALDDFNKGL